MHTNTRGGINRMNQPQPIITSHIQSHHDGGIASSHVTFPPFILNYPPLNPPHALGGLLKLNGLRGGERDTDSRCNFSCWCCCWTMFLQKKTSDLYTYILWYWRCFILVLQFFFSPNILRRHCLPCRLGGNTVMTTLGGIGMVMYMAILMYLVLPE